MLNTYVKVTIETVPKLRFFSLKNLTPGQFWRAPTHTGIIEF